MDALSAEQKQEMATSFAALALYDGEAEISSENIKTLLDAAGVEVEGFYPIIFSQFLNAEKITKLIANPAGSGGGGGGADGEAGGEEAAVEEEKVVVSQSEERSDELTTRSQAAKTTHTPTSVRPPPSSVTTAIFLVLRPNPFRNSLRSSQEEEMDMGGAMDMFGGEEGGGDY